MKVADLSNDPANVRKHSERNIETIMGSLRRFGQQKPIVVDKSGVVRAGNGTLEAARRLGWETIEAAVSELTGSEMTAYAIADNRTAELAEWDEAALAATLESLQFDDEALLEAAGFTDADIKELQDTEGAGENSGDPDAKPELEISPELHERQDYIVIVCDNEFDWIVMTQRLGISTQESGKVETSTIKKTGIGRVITSQQFLKCIDQ